MRHKHEHIFRKKKLEHMFMLHQMGLRPAETLLTLTRMYKQKQLHADSKYADDNTSLFLKKG